MKTKISRSDATALGRRANRARPLQPRSEAREEGELLLRVSGILPVDEFEGFVIETARRLHLRGWTRHEGSGAVLRAAGPEEQLAALVRAIRDDAPASARVRSMDTEGITPETPPIGESFGPLIAEDAGTLSRVA